MKPPAAKSPSRQQSPGGAPAAGTRRRDMPPLSAGVVQRLEEDLRRQIRGEVRFDAGSRALYATDASNYRLPPIGVVVPKDADDVMVAVALCRRYGAPVLARGGGTGLAGQSCNVAVVLDLSKYMRQVLEIDPDTRTARIQPGCVLDDLRHEAEKSGLTFAPDPATHNHNTIGGMIGNNSSGPHSVMGGRTADNIVALDVLLYDGTRMRLSATSEDEYRHVLRQGGRVAEIYQQLRSLADRYAPEIRRRFPQIPRLVSGYSLQELLPESRFNLARALVGSEGTCAIVLEATVQLVKAPGARSLAVVGYPDLYAAGDSVPEVMSYHPIAVEGLDTRLVKDIKAVNLHKEYLGLLPEGAGWLLVEFGGDSQQDADQQADCFVRAMLAKNDALNAVCLNRAEDMEKMWRIRESGLGATAHVPGKEPAWPGWEDSAVPPHQLGNYMRDLRALLDRYGYEGDFYGHFGQGVVHTRISFDLVTDEGVACFKKFTEDAARLCVSYGGSLSGEHGDGQARGALLQIMFGAEIMEAFRQFKRIWDPLWLLNPGKVIDAEEVTAHLRLAENHLPAKPLTFFKYPQDGHDFSRAMQRCVGVGECRRMTGGTMCPSYMATREEKHSTRGRARLLFEMLAEEVVQDGWRSEAVREALDLCLSCKGCKTECPVKVDMATYKAEFMAHYYQYHRRPLFVYAFAFIDRWARLASLFPSLVNIATQTPLLSGFLKRLLKIHPRRLIPPFSPQTFRAWFSRRPQAAPSDLPEVVLWPDTFTNHYQPQTAIHAVEALERAGYRIRIPEEGLCCGRPLYEAGDLVSARRYLQRVLISLARDLYRGLPIIVLEPACASVFKDELLNLFPDDQTAHRLAGQTCLLGEFLLREHKYQAFKSRRGEVLLHQHCHQKTVLGDNAETLLIRQLGYDVIQPETGCCGMAGSFGFHQEKYEVSVACGERALLPAARACSRETIILADGFSCREQIRQHTGRSALHLADVLALDNQWAASGECPEAKFEVPGTQRLKRGMWAALVGMVLAGSVWALWRKSGGRVSGNP